jgi:VWFA-related protein
MKVAGTVSLFLAALAVGLVSAQQPYQFRTKVDMVSVAVAVTDKKGNFIKDLRAEDFIVSEDGVEQKIVLFGAGLEQSWVDLDAELKEELSGEQVMGLILDSSGSMEHDMRLVRQAAIKFLTNIPRTKHMVIVDFDENIRVSEYSSDDQRLIADRIYDVEAEGWTALYDAVATFLERVHAYSGRKALVVYSDGVDSRSALGRGECLDMVRSTDVTIHTIQLGGSSRSSDTARRLNEGAFLREISSLTGGSHAMPNSLEQLDTFYDKILEELYSQYTLGYVSTNTKADGRFRKIGVKVKRDGLNVRARRGYRGPSKPLPAEQQGRVSLCPSARAFGTRTSG